MRASPRKFLALTLAGFVAFALLGRTPGPEAPPPPAGEADPLPEGLALRLRAKQQLAREVVAGRRPLVEAAALFGALNRLPPAAAEPARADAYVSALRVPVRTDEERLCRQVVEWVHRLLLREASPERADEVVARLEAEFLRERRAHGAVRLPDPATLEPVEDLLAQARAWIAEHERWAGPAKGQHD
jgi:hypothetical protein